MHNHDMPSACQQMLQALRQRYGVDFSAYQPTSVLRRIAFRMEQVGVADHDAYLAYLGQEPGEYDQLFNAILINHTAFFRDPEVWAALSAEIIPRIMAHKPPRARLRIWSAGCATGQEPYTLAILLAETLGLEQFAARVMIYATDVDVDALQHVLVARYHPWDARMLPPALLDRYFVGDDDGYVVREELRCRVAAMRHNLIADAPLSQIDLLVCRNVLIYLKPATQARVVAQLRAGLAEHGALVLGRSELALPTEHGLHWMSWRHRIAAKAAAPAARSYEGHWPDDAPLYESA